jgi:hypothetical protein
VRLDSCSAAWDETCSLVLCGKTRVHAPAPAKPLNQAEWTVVRLPSALDLARSGERRRPWLSRSEEQLKHEERIARVRRENGIPSPDELMW